MFVGPSVGGVARRVAAGLLRAGFGVTLVHPDPRELEGDAGACANVVRGDPERPSVLRAALADASGVVWIPRVDMLVNRPDRAVALAELAARACVAARVSSVVTLSIAGRRLGWQLGGPALLRAIEDAFLERVPDVAVLRAGVLMEHVVGLVREVRRRGALVLPIRPEQTVPLVAVADVARRLVELASNTKEGHRIHELRGPEEFSPPEIAAALSAALWQPVEFEALDPDAAVGHFTMSGLDAVEASWLASVCEAANAGLLDPPQPRIHELSAAITLEEWAAQAFGRDTPSRGLTGGLE